MRLLLRSILRADLAIEARSRVVCLMFIELPGYRLARRSLRQGPARHVLLSAGVGGELGGIPTGADRGWCCRFILEATIAAPETKCILGGDFQLGLVLGEVLRARILLKVVRLHL